MKQTHVGIDGQMYEIIESSEVISASGSRGKKYWQGHVVKDMSKPPRFYTTTSSWKDTAKGISKINWAVPNYAEPKNVGRANETTNEEQARLEFESMVTLEKRKREEDRPQPMLAKKFEERKDKLEYPVIVQPKLDGMRLMTDGKVGWSRGNKDQDAQILAHILPFDTEGYVLDGELLLNWRAPVQLVMSAAKKYQPDLTPKLIYVVYDVVCDANYLDRRHLLEKIVKNIHVTKGDATVRLIENYMADDEGAILVYHTDLTARGYEGSIIRGLTGGYLSGKRVDNLLKHKDFVDEEFEIVDIIPAGGGSSAEVGKFVCLAKNGKTFESTAMGSEEYRRNLLNNKQDFIGKFAVVKYRELTPDGKPFHSNVREVRDTANAGY